MLSYEGNKIKVQWGEEEKAWYIVLFHCVVRFVGKRLMENICNRCFGNEALGRKDLLRAYRVVFCYVLSSLLFRRYHCRLNIKNLFFLSVSLNFGRGVKSSDIFVIVLRLTDLQG